jgi:Family of unknown function (DUF6338)
LPASAVALQVFLILLPGFATAYFVQLVAVRGKQSDLDKVVEALLFSFLIYVGDSLVHGGKSFISFSHSPQGDVIDFHPGNVLWLAGFSLLFGLAMIVYVQWDCARILRKLKLTERTSRNSIWNDTFQDIQQTVDPPLGTIVQVELKDGRSVIGVVGYYSDTSDECSVYLRDARWVGDEGEVIRINGPGILLTRNAEITSVSFLNPR